jgi:hypothetical protein
MVVRGLIKGRRKSGGERGGCKLRGSAGRFHQSGVMVVQKAMGLALSGAEKTSASEDKGCHRVQTERIERPWKNGVGRPGARRPSVAQDRRGCLVGRRLGASKRMASVGQDQRIFLVEGCPRAIQGRRGSLDAGR